MKEMSNILKRKIDNEIIERLIKANACRSEVDFIEESLTGKTVKEALTSEHSKENDWIYWLVCQPGLLTFEEQKAILDLIPSRKVARTLHRGWIAQDQTGAIFWFKEKPVFEYDQWNSYADGEFYIGMGRPNPYAHKTCHFLRKKTRVFITLQQENP